MTDDHDEAPPVIQSAAIEAAMTLLVAAAMDHEERKHDGGGCPGERLAILAFAAHALGFPAEILSRRAFITDLRAELQRYELMDAEADAAELPGLATYDGPLH